MAWPMRPGPMKPTFMVASRFSAFTLLQLTLHPFDLAAHVVDDVAGLEVVGQHVPGVGLDLELARQRLRLVEPQRVLDGEAGGPEVRRDRRGTPARGCACAIRAGRGFALPRREGVLEIEEAVELAVPLLDGLGEVDGLGVALRASRRSPASRSGTCSAAASCSLKIGMPASTSFCSDAAMSSYSDRLMADVEHDADVPAQRAIASEIGMPASFASIVGGFAGVEVVGEVIDGLVGGLEEAERLRLERQRHGAAGPLFELDQVRGDAHAHARCSSRPRRGR